MHEHDDEANQYTTPSGGGSISHQDEVLSVFISHRHDDVEIADSFREALEDWSNQTVRVFQSSHAGSAPVIGAQLDESIAKAAADAHIVLLLYTTDDADWSWCMYECGLAQDPSSMKTRLVVFHTTEEPPSPLRHLVTVPFSEAAILSLVDDFHRDQDFFPRRSSPLFPSLDDEQITERAAELHQELSEIIPHASARAVQRYDHLSVALDLNLVQEWIDGEAGGREAMAQVTEVVREHAYIRSVVGEPHGHFNFEAITDGIKLSHLVGRWQEESEHGTLPWPEALFEEMARALLNRKERAVSIAFNSLEPDTDVWLMPVVSHFRVLPSVHCAEFDILLVSVPSESAERMTRVDSEG